MASLPCPVFEGSEKRLEVQFFWGKDTPIAGLRALSRFQLDALLNEAACCIVSKTSSAAFDAYVLSESSLFVYPTKLVLKTCGTTKLLAAVPLLLELAASLSMLPRRCKYSRASYLFPELQPDLYKSFSGETEFLHAYFGHLGGEGDSYILGDAAHGMQWHVYVADSASPAASLAAKPTYTLEVCMTELCPSKAAQFVRTKDFVSARHTTAASGIQSLLGRSEIDDYVFEPCGYSMNGLEGDAFSTIHITPEEGFSYASLELCGYAPDSLDPSAIVAKAMEIFQPGKVTVALSADSDVPGCTWVSGFGPPGSYNLQGCSVQNFGCGGCTAFYNLAAGDNLAFSTHVNLSFDVEAKAGCLPGSPSTVLDNIYSSTGSLAGEGSDAEGAADGSSRSASPSPLDVLADMRSQLRAPLTSGSDVAAGKLPELVAAILRRHDAPILECGGSAEIEARMAELIAYRELEDPLYIVDLGAVARLYLAWMAALPRVTPFYAVKCFTDKAIIALLAALGAGFDCASEAEMSVVLSLGVSPDRVILANCCKRPRDIRAAAAYGVALTTFDTVSELRKLAAAHRGASAVLRIRADDPGARCPLGNKYGCEPEDVLPLLRAAKEIGVKVTGVSFHVGSAATNPAAFTEAIEKARTAFDAGTKLGFAMDLLDIGGGFSSGTFCGQAGNSIPAAVTAALDEHFPEGCGVRVISEPGRYFTEEAATLSCMIYGVRDCPGSPPSRDYWIPDGLYGSMNSLLYDHAVLRAHPLGRRGAPPTDDSLPSTVFGPTCDGLDVVLKNVKLPRLENGDWLVFPDMGAYTLAGACNFNGMGVSEANVSYVYSLK